MTLRYWFQAVVVCKNTPSQPGRPQGAGRLGNSLRHLTYNIMIGDSVWQPEVIQELVSSVFMVLPAVLIVHAFVPASS